MPAVKVIGLLVNPKNPASASETNDVQAAAQALGLQLHVRNASNEQDIDAAFASFAEQKRRRGDLRRRRGLQRRRAQLIALAARHTLPTMYFYREFANDGGLISYGGFDTDAYRLAGVYAGRILKGEKPADLPVQQVTKVELVINLKTAKALGIDVPLTLLGRADEVIGSTLMYGSSFCIVTRRPRDFRSRPSEDAVIPLPREDATPPVTKMCLVNGRPP